MSTEITARQILHACAKGAFEIGPETTSHIFNAVRSWSRTDCEAELAAQRSERSTGLRGEIAVAYELEDQSEILALHKTAMYAGTLAVARKTALWKVNGGPQPY